MAKSVAKSCRLMSLGPMALTQVLMPGPAWEPRRLHRVYWLGLAYESNVALGRRGTVIYCLQLSEWEQLDLSRYFMYLLVI
jgi:hypothetical protein